MSPNITQQGNLFGNNVNLLAQQKLINLGGKIQALESVALVGRTIACFITHLTLLKLLKI
ncbi:hypothetical protein A6A20_03290 [Volucribacter amazonae]|uniref:Uncharacterized protein n=1 Tax=Volucribacter amazonae TaxID=256731 RepID=A0A9X4PGF0_9PAST|nr:hypothetical protein [Volucribacter amazonae]